METNEYILKDDKTLIIKDGVKILREQVYSKLKVKKLILSDSVLEIEGFAFYNNNIEEVVFNKNLEKIGKYAFSNNNIKYLNLPDKIKVIEMGSFQNNKISKLLLPESLEIISKSAFEGNYIDRLFVPSDVIEIASKAFKNNLINELILNDKITVINEESFMNNRLDDINLNNVLTIKPYAFCNNRLKNVIFDNVYEIENNAFQNNYIENINFGNYLQKIGKEAFHSNILKNIDLKNTSYIDVDAFCNNKLESVKCSNAEVINDEAFSYNNISNIKLNDDIKHIGKGLLNGNRYVNLEFKDKIYDYEFLIKYGSENILKINEIFNLLPYFDLKKFNKDELLVMPLDKTILNGIDKNYKKFTNVIDDIVNTKESFNNIYLLDKSNDYYIIFFKLAYAFGVFTEGKDEIELFKEFVLTHDLKSIKTQVINFKLKKFDKKFNDIIKLYLEKKDKYLINYIDIIYNDIKDIKKFALKKNEDIITKTNTLKIKTGSNEYDEFLNYMKKNKKQIKLDDVNNYIKTKFNNYKNLEDVILILSYYNNDKSIEKINNIHKMACQDDCELYFKNIEKTDGEYSYKWLPSSDTTNFILGYEVNCCSKIGGAGEDIMIQSVVNPNVKNLVIYKNNEIIGKSTAFYNPDLKYIVFNNIEIKDKAIINKSFDKNAFLKIFLTGINDQLKSMDYDVIDVRVGLSNNDLYDEITKNFEIDKRNMVENFRYKGYNGDANNPKYGQAVIKRK